MIFFVAAAAAIYAALCLALFLAQRSFIYYPQPKGAGDNGSTLILNVGGERVLVSTRAGRGPDALSGRRDLLWRQRRRGLV